MSPTPEKTDPSVTPTDLPTTANCNDIITKEFLQNALKMEANGGPVPEIISHFATLGTKPGDNYASIIYSVDVDLSDGTKRHLLIKCYPNHPARQELTNKCNMFFKECEVYSKWIPALKRMQKEVFGLDKEDAVKLPYAKFVHGECIDFQSEEGEARKSGPISSLDNYIMMEDLRKTHGFRMTNRLEPLDLDHMRLIIEALSKVHAMSWAYRHHVEADITEKFPCLVTNMASEDLETWNNVIRANLEQTKGIYDKEFGQNNDYSAAVDKFSGMIGRIGEFFTAKGTAVGMDKMMRITNPDPAKFGKDAENPEPWRIICHGDCWSNNMVFRYDSETGKPLEIVLLDLQMPQETCVVNDLEYVIFVGTTLEFRRIHLDDLLQLYHDTFNGICEKFNTPTLPGFCMDSLQYRFHRAKFLGYYMATMVVPIMLKEGEVKNLEDMDEGKDLTDAFIEICKADTSSLVKDRLIQVMKGMLEDGVF
ncbi:uncharacterized protein LOC110853643 [Folsomia candida]|uniref:CHK kinase-like domain-containing protein n=1 Tax=Folsomia candida TaxID=158441 RepID=A0A226E3R0_FOLCA|nr:uncharacterized protein LOC110853643 [Folsomia candida]OXA51136.1 hypothetical protein Fcan01_14553 [Folsomia candida]